MIKIMVVLIVWVRVKMMVRVRDLKKVYFWN